MSRRSPGGPALSSSPEQGLGVAALQALERCVPGGIRARATDRYAMAHDASHYLMTPTAVAVPRDAGEVAALLTASR